MHLRHTPEREALARELRAYFAELMTPERREALRSIEGDGQAPDATAGQSGRPGTPGEGTAYREVVRQLGAGRTGAVVGAVGFYVLKRGFDFWASHSAGISALPRSLVSVTLLLVWLGFFGQIILYGAALNVVRDRRKRGEPIFPDTPHPEEEIGAGR